MQMSKYVRLSRGLKDKGILIKPDEVFNHIQPDKDYYTSVFYYNPEQLRQFKETGSIRNIEDVTTDKIVLDFDSKTDLSLAAKDALEAVYRLQRFGIDKKAIEVYFSGSKGYTVVVRMDREITPSQLANIALNKIGRGLNTLDKSIYNASRILRVPGTKHQVSGLYKIPITIKELESSSPDDIKKKAQSLDNITEDFDWDTATPSDDLFVEEKQEEKKIHIDVTTKPRNWRNCKWSLLQGQFKEGERHTALMVLAATARGMGFDKDTAYYLCKSALKKQATLTGQDEFPKEELYTNVIESTYDTHWSGGQYTCQKPGWLQTYCQGLDEPCKEHSDANTVKIEDAFGMFKNYATNIDALTIKTGIPVLDNKMKMTIGMSVGIVAPPGVGKTSLALQILNSMSRNNEQALFLSYDMFHALVFQKLIQKHFNMQPDEIFKKFKSGDKDFEQRVLNLIGAEYKNVRFCFKAGQTYEEILDTIKETEDETGKKVKLVVCDYNELVLTNMSDSTSSSNYVAQKMREIANVQQTCVLSLFQPNKMSGSPADEITSYRSAKGGSGIEQSVSIMLGMSRPGYNPRKPETDRFMTINCLKNRMGSLFAADLYWDGLTGSIRELSSEEENELEALRQEKEEQKEKDDANWT